MKVLFVEEQPLYLDALSDILRRRFGEVEASCVTSVAAAVQALAEASFHLVVADLGAGDVGERPGLESILEAAGGALVAVLDARPVGSHARRVLAAGAKAYIPKTSSPELIDAALGVVLAGGSYFPDIAAQKPGVAAKNPLSPRQQEVADLLHKGFSNSEIAAALGISVATVKLHVHAILKATGARNRTDLVVRNARRSASS